MGGGSRTRSGCANCRRRKKRCDEIKPICQRCQAFGESCLYPSASNGLSVSRLLISSASEHYILPVRSPERLFVNFNQHDLAHLCLAYASGSTDVSQSHTLDMVDEADHQVPRSLQDILIPTSERGYLEYYMEVISASRVYITGPDNEFRSLIMPLACTRRGPVLFTILALSASEMANAGSSSSDRLRLAAAQYYNSAIVQLQQSLTHMQSAEENLLTCVLLSTFEITNGNRPVWLQHLNGAVAIFSRFDSSIGREHAMFALRYFVFRWILLETTMPPGTYTLEEVVGDTSMTSRLLNSLNATLQQATDAIPNRAMQQIDNNLGCSLEFLQLINRLSTLSALRFHDHIENSSPDGMSDLYSSTTLAFDQSLIEMTFVARTSDYYLEYSSQCFKLAGRTFLRLVCCDMARHQENLLDIQNKLLQTLRLVINKDEQRRAFPMWPLFIAGCASFEDEHRSLVLSMFRILEKKWPISNIHLVRSVTTQIWKNRDLNGVNGGRQHDWQKLITTFGWKLALS